MTPLQLRGGVSRRRRVRLGRTFPVHRIGKVSPHLLRRTHASLRAALRDDPIYIAEQLGHRDPRFAFRVYQRAAKRRARLAGPHLAAFLDRALEWAGMGRGNRPWDDPRSLCRWSSDAGIRGAKLESRSARL